VRTAVGQFVRKFGGELSLQLAKFGFGLDYLLVWFGFSDQLLFGALFLEREVCYLVWLSSLGFVSRMILCQG
jgi:hypothetical protein